MLRTNRSSRTSLKRHMEKSHPQDKRWLAVKSGKTPIMETSEVEEAATAPTTGERRRKRPRQGTLAGFLATEKPKKAADVTQNMCDDATMSLIESSLLTFSQVTNPSFVRYVTTLQCRDRRWFDG